MRTLGIKLKRAISVDFAARQIAVGPLFTCIDLRIQLVARPGGSCRTYPEGPARIATRSVAGGDGRTQPGVLTPGSHSRSRPALKGQLENELTRIVQRMPRRLFAECLYSSSFCLLICDLKFRYGLSSAATSIRKNQRQSKGRKQPRANGFHEQRKSGNQILLKR
jgi:hypothetical protein